MSLATRLRSLGVSLERINELVYRPFIVAGPAWWSDSWGAPRHGEGDSLRPHLGQDVVCDHGAPVLAAEKGRVRFGADTLGGLVARLYRRDGTYWYYAHLSGYNKDIASGQRVAAGTVIGYCGTSGNARGSAPHVHFALMNGGAGDPMLHLMRWLETAERRATARVRQMVDVQQRHRRLATTMRRMGDGFVPRPPRATCPACRQHPAATSATHVLGFLAPPVGGDAIPSFALATPVALDAGTEPAALMQAR